MTPAQKKLYWRAWAECWRALRVLRPDLTSADATRERHDLNRRSLGYPRSMLELDNRELDAVLGSFRAISRPDDLNSQRRQINQPRLRLLWLLERELFPALSRLLGGDQSATSYLIALLDDRWNTDDITTLSDASLRQLVMTISSRIKSLEWRSKDDPALILQTH